ncbi:hypothetical protein ACHQM5_024884 [Ranunculus cassubicifolius]
MAKRQKIDHTADFLSRLPDDIFSSFIFPGLSAKEATRLCITSKEMEYLRTWIPDLEFQEPLGFPQNKYRRNLVKTIDKSLKDRKNNVNSFKIRFTPLGYKSQYAEWINMLISLSVKEVDIDFNRRSAKPANLPTSLFRLNEVKSLKLQSCSFDVPDEFSGLKYLDMLHLGHVTLYGSQLVSFMSKCKNLSVISLERCNCVGNIDFSNTSVRSLQYADQKLRLSVKGATELINVVIYRGTNDFPDQDEAYGFRREILEHLRHVESLSLMGWAFKCLAQGDAVKILEIDYISLMKLEVEICLSSREELLALSCLFERAKHVQNLLLLMSQESCWDGNLDCWTQKLGEKFGQNHFNELRTIEINKLKGTAFDFGFVEFVLENAGQLQRMSITLIDEGTFMSPRNRRLSRLIREHPNLIHVTVNNNIIS